MVEIYDQDGRQVQDRRLVLGILDAEHRGLKTRAVILATAHTIACAVASASPEELAEARLWWRAYADGQGLPA